MQIHLRFHATDGEQDIVTVDKKNSDILVLRYRCNIAINNQIILVLRSGLRLLMFDELGIPKCFFVLKSPLAP